MSIPNAIQSHLAKDETVLWHCAPVAPNKLSAYKGAHDLLARAFFAASGIAAILFYFHTAETGRVGLSWPLIGTVGVPIVVGLGIKVWGRFRARRMLRAQTYAVTSHRVLITTQNQPITFTIRNDSAITHDTRHGDISIIRMTDAAHFPYGGPNDIPTPIYKAPKGMILSKEDAELALTAINAVQEGIAA